MTRMSNIWGHIFICHQIGNLVTYEDVTPGQASSMPTNIKAQPRRARPLRTSPRINQPPSAAKTASMFIKMEAWVGLASLWPTTYNV